MIEMVPSPSIIVTFALASFALAITPGPDLALFISRTISFGTRHGLVSVLGAVTGIFIHTMLAAFGISMLIVAAPTAFMVLKIAGALYLIWLAVAAVRSGGGVRLQQARERAPTFKGSYLAGLGMNLTNPKVALFFVTFLPQFVSADDPAVSAKLVFLGLELVLVSLPVVIGAVLAARWLAGALLGSPRVQKALNWGFAAVFAGFAATILLAEARR